MAFAQDIAKYLELKAQEKALKAQLKAVEDSIKSNMSDLGVSEVSDGGFVARIVVGNQRRFDTKKFKEDYADVYESYRKDVPTKEFQAFCQAPAEATS